jgi:flagellin
MSTVATTGYLTYDINTSAAQASVAVWTNTSADAWSVDTLTINGVGVTLTGGDTQTIVTSKINAVSAQTGVHLSAGTTNTFLVSNSYGRMENVSVQWSASGAIRVGASSIGTTGATGIFTIGTDVAGTINGSGASGNGLTLVATGDQWSGTSVTFTYDGNLETNVQSTDMHITKSQLKFAIGAYAATNEFVSFQINDMRSTNLGTSTHGFLDNSTTGTSGNGIKTGQGNALATNAAGAVTIIDDAISSVSNERSKLGAYQKNAIETMQNNLGASLENIQSAESRIRDLDMAKEMMNFTKNQILIQAGTAMLAQANMIPQSALSLIR